jgi:hypothetical protein
MSDCCDTPATSCKPFTKVEEKCAIVDCLYKKVTVTTTVDALCVQTIVITDGDDVLPPDTALVVCKDPTPVVAACEKPPALPVDAPTTTCGADTTVKAADLLSQAVHTAPGTALLVKLCPADPEFDREMEKLCAPDGTKVLVQDVTPKDAPLGTAPTLNFWTLAIPSVPYTGDTSLLKDCGAEKIDISPAAWFCSNNEQVSRSDAWDISVSPRTLIGVIWQDISGAVIPAPAAGTYTQGECAKCEVTKHFKFAWYKEGTTCRKIEVLKILDCDDNLTLKGFEISGTPIATFDPLNLFAGEAKELMRDICVTLKGVAPATEGVRWDLKEVTTTTPCGDTTVKYFDPDVSPMVEVAESLIECINGEGKCPCCEPKCATLSAQGVLASWGTV